jgi:hypothetical protein
MPTPAISIQLTSNNLSRLDEVFDNKKFLEGKICMPQPASQSKSLERKFTKNHHIKIEILKDAEYTFPLKLSHIAAAIENAKYILSLEEDWDCDGAIEIPHEIFNRAVNFIRDYSTFLLANNGLLLVAPIISPLKDGSIDLLWETKNNSLLVNIKNSDTNDAYYYGVIDIKNQKNDFNGNIKTTTILPLFSNWLKEYPVGN